jgi:ribosomal protein S14
MLTTYPDCDVMRPDMPPRSRLYALEPCGLGTPLIEGLPSYVLRLAAWHQVPVALLLERELLPRLPTPLPPPGRHGHWHTFRRVLSSFTATTAQWVQVLADLTGRTDLARLTLLPWQAVLPPATLRRYTHAWCPACYAAWHAAEQPRYTPLLWQIRAVTHCPQHGTPLQEQCPTCGQPQPTLAWRKQLGVCRQCQTPLRVFVANGQKPTLTFSEATVCESSTG